MGSKKEDTTLLGEGMRGVGAHDGDCGRHGRGRRHIKYVKLIKVSRVEHIRMYLPDSLGICR